MSMDYRTPWQPDDPGVRYRRLLSAMSSAVTVSDGKGRIERPHPELSKLIGMEWPAYRGGRWLASIHPDDQKLLLPQGPFKDIDGRADQYALAATAYHLLTGVPLFQPHVAVNGAGRRFVRPCRSVKRNHRSPLGE